MFTNYLKIALRTLQRNRVYTLINVLGLSVGIGACILIFLLVNYEMSFDAFFPNHQRIYRVVSVINRPEGTSYTAGVPFPIANGLRTEFPDGELVGAIHRRTDVLVTVPSKGASTTKHKFLEKSGIFYVEPQFFDIFKYRWLAGEPTTALSDPNTAVLTKSVADKYFGNWKEAPGQVINVDNSEVFRITGIIEDVPSNSDLPLTIVVSYKTQEVKFPQRFKDWVSTSGSNYCFVLLPPGLTSSTMNGFLNTLVKEHKPPLYQNRIHQLQPLSAMHFDSRFGNYNHRTFGRELIDALILVGVFLLIMACVNFINLATALAVVRAREIGVRKVLGGNRRQLAIQFLSETAVLCFFSVILGIGVAELGLPLLDRLLDVPLGLGISPDPNLIGFILVIYAATVLVSGMYPAIVLSSFNPTEVIKAKAMTKTIGGVSLRRGLVVFQFVVAQFMIFGMIAVVSQLDYLRNRPTGFDRDAIMTVSIPDDSVSQARIPALKNRLIALAGVRSASFSMYSAASTSRWSSDFKFDNSSVHTNFSADLLWGDPDFFKTYGLKLIAGRVYPASDTANGFVVNETLLKTMGIRDADAVLGKRIDLWDGQVVAPIVGVVKDFNDHPLDEPIPPVIMGAWRDNYDQINIKIGPGNLRETLASIERIWNETFPDYVYEYQFLDQSIDDFYKQQGELSLLYTTFAGIAILISALGLYGLVSFMAERRTKEVGIRKVLGASSRSILVLFSKEFVVLVAVAFVISAPIEYAMMNQWLSNFTYRVGIGVGPFLLTVGAILVVTCLSIGYQSLRAAKANPVEALRYE